MIGLPSLGPKICHEANMIERASATASFDNGTWTAIWSPSKSALKAVVTNGCKWIAFPLTIFTSKAWIPKRCNVGARFNKTGRSLITFSTTSQIMSSWLAIFSSACLMVVTCGVISLPSSSRFLINSWMINGLNNFKIIAAGIPTWYIFNSGPITITERPE